MGKFILLLIFNRDRPSQSSITTDIPTGSELTTRDRDNRAPLSARSITTASVSSESRDRHPPGSARSYTTASISTESRASRGGAAHANSISAASVISDSRLRGSGVGSASSVATDSGARPASPPSKSDSIAEEIQSEKGKTINIVLLKATMEDILTKHVIFFPSGALWTCKYVGDVTGNPKQVPAAP